jgi:hypothetical protein
MHDFQIVFQKDDSIFAEVGINSGIGRGSN